MLAHRKKEFFTESMETINKINPLQPNFHYKMLNQLKNYHLNAKKRPDFSLLQSLQIFSKFCVTDIWLNRVVNEEIEFLKTHKINNPYHKK
jgi:hypothetical protein